ncbi:hypothetical protein C5167_017504 [Papaver somniferum]|uniref:Exocyst component Exo84 C-terminal domain-containing protein n=1 Tax=Papaver somniferum TaxID=3469 RepID=A0A4Y7INL5_PAPSO|nr:hypothetical protein C5167_017504 [Papaver somniferum]
MVFIGFGTSIVFSTDISRESGNYAVSFWTSKMQSRTFVEICTRLPQDLMTGVCRELEERNQDNSETLQAEEDAQGSEHQDLLAEERSSPELNGLRDASSTYKSAFIKRKVMLEDQLIEIAEQPSLGVKELKLALSVKENSPPSEMVSALRAVSICVQASLSHCFLLESKDLKLSKLLMTFSLSPRFASPLSAVAVSSSDSELLDSGTRFMYIVNDIVEQLTPAAIDQYGGNILNRISQLFDKYVDALIKFLPGPSEDDNLIEHKEVLTFRAETDAQQLALLGTAFTVADELLPMAVSKIWTGKSEGKEPGSGSSENIVSTTVSSIDFKEWRRHLQHSLDKLRDYFCLHYVLNFIYAREDRIRLDARIYVKMQGEDLWETYPLPSLPFQALFSKFQQLATVAGDVLLGKEKIQKILLSRLTETVVMWLSDEQEFWDVFKDETHPLHPLGLQQLILDMHFIVEIAVFGGYPSRHVHQIASAIIARAIKAFSNRGIDPQSSELPADEWFVNSAKTALNKLILGTSSASEVSDIDEHIIIHDEIISDSDDTASCPSSIASSSDSFASANMGESESPTFLSDSEG